MRWIARADAKRFNGELKRRANALGIFPNEHPVRGI